MNLQVKIDKYGNLVNMQTNAILVASSDLFPNSIFTSETVDDYWKVISQGSGSITSKTFSTFSDGDTITYYFKFYLPIVSYSTKSQIFELDLDGRDSKDIGFYKKASNNNWSLYLNDSRVDLSLSSDAVHIVQGYLTLNKLSTSVAVNAVVYEKINSSYIPIIDTFVTISNISSGNIGIAVGEDVYGTGTAKLVEDTRYYEDVLIPSNTKYLNGTGLSEVWTNTKNYISAQLLGKSDVGHTHSDYIPRSGGAVMTGDLLASSTTYSLGFGYGWGNGGTIYTYSPTHSTVDWQGTIRLEPLKTTSYFKTMTLAPNGTWAWNGTACQITSDQRLKQQITEIDDKLLDAWEDVELSQFKYNDAVDQKGKDKARLHTGYVVQQIDNACKSHGVDVSKYGLYCHEEYPEETEEVEVEQADGTIKKETKVIREASEHYSLRYTETLVVECAYLRRENSRLKENLASLEERLEKLEKAENQEK